MQILLNFFKFLKKFLLDVPPETKILIAPLLGPLRIFTHAEFCTLSKHLYNYSGK